MEWVNPEGAERHTQPIISDIVVLSARGVGSIG